MYDFADQPQHIGMPTAAGAAVVASSFQMYGGTISGNSATGVGGG